MCTSAYLHEGVGDVASPQAEVVREGLENANHGLAELGRVGVIAEQTGVGEELEGVHHTKVDVWVCALDV